MVTVPDTFLCPIRYTLCACCVQYGFAFCNLSALSARDILYSWIFLQISSGAVYEKEQSWHCYCFFSLKDQFKSKLVDPNALSDQVSGSLPPPFFRVLRLLLGPWATHRIKESEYHVLLLDGIILMRIQIRILPLPTF